MPQALLASGSTGEDHGEDSSLRDLRDLRDRRYMR